MTESLKKCYLEATEVFDKYLNNKGVSNLTLSEAQIKQYLRDNEVVIDKSFLLSDLCYNFTTKSIGSSKEFETTPRLFEYVGRNKYRVLGSKYTGDFFIKNKSNGNLVACEWKNGKIIKLEIINDERELIQGLDSVEKFALWKKLGSVTVEVNNIDATKDLGWERTDVLYSFLGVYTIGLLAYYPDLFHKGRYVIKDDEGNKMYTEKRFLEVYNSCKELNNNKGLVAFIKNYFSLGNVIPIWPGGNADRGQSYVYDIPEIYFSSNKLWSYLLTGVYHNCHLDEVLDDKLTFRNGKTYNSDTPSFDFSSTTKFLNSICSDEYSKDVRVYLYSMWLNRIVEIIRNRTKELKRELRKLGK